MRIAFRFLFTMVALGFLGHCTSPENLDEVKRLKNNKFEYTDAEKKALILEAQKKILDGYESSTLLKKLIVAMDADPKVTRTRQTFKIDSVAVSSTDSSTKVGKLRTKRAAYLSLSVSALDSYGFVPGCDGLLFTSLYRAGGSSVSVYSAESTSAKGKWYRSGAQNCYPTESSSTISKDMMTGLLYALSQNSDLETVQDILSFSRAAKWIIGEAVDEDTLYGRAYMTPGLASNYYVLQKALGGASHPSTEMPAIYSAPSELKGYELHLQVLSIYLRGLLRGGISEYEYRMLQAAAESNSGHAFYSAAFHAYSDGDMSAAADLLLSETHFPASSLPTLSNHCEPYLWQLYTTDDGWKSCQSSEHPSTHSGADLVFLSTLILNELKSY